MNTRLFIGEVKKRKALWDHTNTNYHNRRMLTDGWRDIAKMFNTEGKTPRPPRAPFYFDPFQ
ncbi:hypothetical protein GEV33_002917 [Tenebrio molitor]|jgi:hypothetical protein|uniref:MADF domain-containing protein n=1 Tax=Tenebrio molitor TaxID=7067 RepID=A0A8J6HSH8_TENMO|nr:hypothetical protein GEV33_002917 [Tenebrio molitor]